MLSFSTYADGKVISYLLNELNRGLDQTVKSSIIRTLGEYNNDPLVLETLKRKLSDPYTPTKQRIEAARSLSSRGEESSVSQLIIRAHDQSRNIPFRAEMIRCLYKYAPSNLNVRKVLVDNIKGNNDIMIKEASAFALHSSLEDQRTRDEVIVLSESSYLSIRTRVSLIKTLFHDISRKETEDTLIRIARSLNTPIEIRSAATRVLATKPLTRSNRNLLFNVLSSTNETAIIMRAVKGLSFKITEEDIRWLNLPKDPRSGFPRYFFNKL